jgi:hypothetical protein
MYDWTVRHKASAASAKGLWDFGANLLPENNTMGDFGALENMLRIHRKETVIKVHCCIDMCVGFFNPTHKSLAGRVDLMNAHRTSCPRCGKPRYVWGTKNTPVRYFWYLPIKFWLQDLFAKGDLVPHMANDLDPQSFPDGHVRRCTHTHTHRLSNAHAQNKQCTHTHTKYAQNKQCTHTHKICTE